MPTDWIIEEAAGSYARTFEDLHIWKSARDQVKVIYVYFDRCRDLSFKDQICRAAVSVMNNIAEGFERETPKDFIRFLITAKSSNGELRSMTYAAEDLSYLSPELAQTLRQNSLLLSKSIASLIRHLKSKLT